MPKATLISTGLPDLLPMRDRSPGVHLTDIIDYLCINLGHYKRSEFSESSMSRMQLGCAWEHAIAQRYALDAPDRYIYQPGEVFIGEGDDAIPGTPDILDAHDFVPEEVKATWMSSRHQPGSDKFKKYEWQLMGQCIGYHTNRGRLHACHVMGDYKGFEVHNNVWEYEFSKSELSMHRDLLLKTRDKMLRDNWQRRFEDGR